MYIPKKCILRISTVSNKARKKTLSTNKARNNDDFKYIWRIMLITVNSIIRTVDYPNSFEWSLRSPDNRGCTVHIHFLT